jgi:hypothetical protein
MFSIQLEETPELVTTHLIVNARLSAIVELIQIEQASKSFSSFPMNLFT